MKFGCCTDIKNYDTMVALGYDFIELNAVTVAAMSEDEFAATRAKIAAGPLPCLGFNAYCNGAVPMIGEGFDIKKVDEYAQFILGRGAALGIKNAGLGAPLARIYREGEDYELAWSQMQESVSTICHRAAEHGIDLLFEALNRETCNFIITTPEAVRFVSSLDIENLHLVLDFYHMEVMGEGDEEAKLALPLTTHTHISQRDPHQRSYLRWENYDQYEKRLGILKKSGYNSSLSIESKTEDFEREAKITLDIFHKIFQTKD